MRTPPAPRAVFFDWHGTLADTFEAMYHAVDDLLRQLDRHALEARVVAPERCRTTDHAALVRHVLKHRHLPLHVVTARRISRTEIFEILFGRDEDAKHLAHDIFDHCYLAHFGEVHPFEPSARAMLERLRRGGLRLGMLTNRRRGLFRHELGKVDGSGWTELFDVVVCGDDVRRRKPAPDMVTRAMNELGLRDPAEAWFVGDSSTDVTAAKSAGVAAVYYNGAGWSAEELDHLFPGTPDHPHRPDAVVDDFSALEALLPAPPPAH